MIAPVWPEAIREMMRPEAAQECLDQLTMHVNVILMKKESITLFEQGRGVKISVDDPAWPGFHESVIVQFRLKHWIVEIMSPAHWIQGNNYELPVYIFHLPAPKK